MPCLIIIILLGMPRLALFLIWLFSDWTQRAFETRLWPILGFCFLPYTTIAYLCASLETNHQIDGPWIILIVLGLICDFGFHGSSTRYRRYRIEEY